MTIDQVIDDLRATIRVIVRHIAVTTERFDRDYPGTDPALCVDDDGRPILLDAYIGLANARAALLNAITVRENR